ncbi:MAG: hypothetical protein JXR31_16535 [Prolixibacteraceae bacterium]|nr:hypothetical protein [Prolixibacteraceae bacterium]
MKRKLILFVAALVICFSGHSEKRYVIKKITDEGSNYFAVNNLGEIAYVGVDEQGHQQVYFYSGGIIYQLTETPSYSYSYYSIDINDQGHIVWSMSSSEDPSKTKYVIMYYNGDVHKLIDDLFYYWNFEPNVKINNSDVVVWHQPPYYGAKTQCYKFDGKIHNLGGGVNNPNMYPVINDNGLIAWFGDNRWGNDWDYHIRYTTPGDTIVKTIPQGVYEGSSSPRVDNLNNIFFNRYDNGYYDLYRFDGNEQLKIADSIFSDFYAVCNGNIVYTKGVQNDYTVYLFSPEGIIALASGGDYYYPDVNSTGVCVWRNGVNEIFTNRDGGSKKIGEDCHKPPKIIDDGTIVFAGYDWDDYGSAIYAAEYKEVWDLSGKVLLNSAGGPGFEGVSIISDGKVIGTTDENGDFFCQNLEPGEYTISFLKPGYSFMPATVTIGLNNHYTLPENVIATVNTNIKELTDNMGITLFPVPANEVLNIRMDREAGIADKITISTMEGKILKLITGSAIRNENFNVKININGFKPGIYNCAIELKGQTIIKQFSVIN